MPKDSGLREAGIFSFKNRILFWFCRKLSLTLQPHPLSEVESYDKIK